jgi:hypothetical protein
VDLEQRVRRLAAEAGDLSSVRADVDRLLRSHVAYDVASIATVDPATMLWTSCFVSGLPSDGERDREQLLYELEFAEADLNGYAELANSGRLVGRLHQATGGDLTLAKRWEPLLAPFGCTDEMRVILRSRDLTWGTLSLYRGAPNPPFDERDERVVRTAAGAIADLFRLTMLRAALSMPSGIDRPPGVILTSTGGAVEAADDAARSWLEAIDDRDRIPSAVRSVAAAATSGNGLARAALPTPGGQWVVLHASRIDAEHATVAVVIEGARPIVVSEVIAGAYGLTPANGRSPASPPKASAPNRSQRGWASRPSRCRTTSRPCSPRSASRAGQSSSRPSTSSTTNRAGRLTRRPARTAGTSTTTCPPQADTLTARWPPGRPDPYG